MTWKLSLTKIFKDLSKMTLANKTLSITLEKEEAGRREMRRPGREKRQAVIITILEGGGAW